MSVKGPAPQNPASDDAPPPYADVSASSPSENVSADIPADSAPSSPPAVAAALASPNSNTASNLNPFDTSNIPPHVGPRPSPNINFYHKNQSISGEYTLDLNAAESEPPNGYDAYFECHNGSVKIELRVIGELNPSRPAKICVKSKNGAVRACITSSTLTQTFDIDISSHNGAVNALLPQQFSGVLNISSHNGNTKIMPRLLAQSEPRTQNEYVVRSADHHSSKKEPEPFGTACCASHNGSVKVGLASTTDGEDITTGCVVM